MNPKTSLTPLPEGDEAEPGSDQGTQPGQLQAPGEPRGPQLPLLPAAPRRGPLPKHSLGPLVVPPPDRVRADEN